MKALHNTKIRVRVDDDSEVEVRIKSQFINDLPLYAWLNADMARELVADLIDAIQAVDS